MRKLILFSSLFFCSTLCFAQSGEPDPSFGNNGIVTTDMGSAFNYTNFGKQVLLQSDGSIYLIFEGAGLTLITKKHPDGSTDVSYGNSGYSISVPIYEAHAALQTDGKIVVVGYTINSDQYYNPYDFAVVRFNTDGSLDYTFGNGIQTIDFGYYDRANAVAIQSDGKIVVAGTVGRETGNSFVALARYNTDGSPDISFDGDGKQTTNFGFGHYGYASSVAIQTDGKIVVGGSSLLRYDTNGALDISFNGDGHRLISGASAIAIQSDGKIIVVSNSTNDIGDKDFELARYNTDGILDGTFGIAGIQTTDFGGSNETATSIVIQSNGKIILGGYTGDDSNINFAIARYKIDGGLDNSFSGDGKQITDLGSSNDYINSIAIQSNGKLVALGYTVNGVNTYVAAARYNKNGKLDKAFDGEGTLTDHINQGSTFYTGTAIQSDGKILSAGYTWNGSNYDFALVRYNTNGSLDNTFSGDGKQMTDFGSSDDKARAIVIQSDGKIVVAGSAGDNFGLARYNTDGSPDITFDGDGMQITDFGSSDYATSIAIQTDGKIVVGGSALARYNTNGSLDMSFDGDGKLTIPFNCTGVAIQNDGKIVIVGNTQNLSVARYNINGSEDGTFNNGMPFQAGQYTQLIGTSIAIQNDGKIVIGGYYVYIYRTTLSQFALMRLKTDGTADNTFNGTGILFTAFNYNDYGTSVLIQNDDKIILGGYSYNGSSDDFTIARFNTDGSLDNTFSSDGIVVTQASVAYDRIAAIAISNDKLYAAGYGQYPGNFGVVARYLLAESGPLPVSLLDFKAIPQNKSVLLQWKIATEKNLNSFIVERSPDGNRFLPINSVTAAGVSTFTGHNSIMDEQPLQGINFYRLKIVDADGKFSYSNTVAVKINTDKKFQIFPNPAKGVLFVEANGNKENAIVQIVDGGGRNLKEVKVFLNGKTSFSVDVSSLPKGIYNLILHKNEKREVQTFVKD